MAGANGIGGKLGDMGFTGVKLAKDGFHEARITIPGKMLAGAFDRAKSGVQMVGGVKGGFRYRLFAKDKRDVVTTARRVQGDIRSVEKTLAARDAKVAHMHAQIQAGTRAWSERYGLRR